MNHKKAIKLAALILSQYKCIGKTDDSFFITREQMINILPENDKNVQLTKLLKIIQFQDSFKKVNGKTCRGSWVVQQDQIIDISKLGLSNFDHEEAKSKNPDRPYFFASEDVIKYISDNWYSLSLYMTHDIVMSHTLDPSLKSMSQYKKNNAIKLAGFVPSFTLFEENRTPAKPRLAKNETRKSTANSNMILHPEYFPNDYNKNK